MSSESTPSAKLAASLAALRTRYLATAAGTVAAVRELGERMAALEHGPAGTHADGDAMATLATALRREVHRVRGTAGTYGLATVARVCADAEARAQAWVASPLPDRGGRGAATASLARALAAAFETDASAVEAAGSDAAMDAAVAAAVIDAPAADALAGATLGADAAVALDAAAPTADSGGHDAAWLADVVVVEDDDDLAEMLGYSLEAVGAAHVRYADGPTALDALLARPASAARPVVLLDVDLPGMDGHTVHESLRAARPRGAEVVFMTAHAAEHEQVRAYTAGALDYVVKPVSLRVLLAKLPVWRRAAARG
jgi:CheY-like chemotaxis protein